VPAKTLAVELQHDIELRGNEVQQPSDSLGSDAMFRCKLGYPQSVTVQLPETTCDPKKRRGGRNGQEATLAIVARTGPGYWEPAQSANSCLVILQYPLTRIMASDTRKMLVGSGVCTLPPKFK